MSELMSDTEVLILGGGPAAAAVALGLRRLDYAVRLVTEPRPFDAVEGISDRVVEGMRHAGFERALETLALPSPRQVTWNGETSAANTERLISRRDFDRALIDDLTAAGVEVIPGRVGRWQMETAGHRVEITAADGSERLLEAGFVVEGRGRAAPAAGIPRIKGAETISLLQYWQGPEGPARSAVESFAGGWAWMAMRADGRRYLQLTLDVKSAQLPPKAELADWCRTRLERLEQAQPFIRDAEPVGEVQGRISTPTLCARSAGDNWIRVGDAAMAVDPLSGNGIFQALSSALQAPAVIHTLLSYPQNRTLAQQFHEARIEGLFYRFARIGRDFYAQESQWPQQPFWLLRGQWPDSEPLHRDVSPHEVQIARRPVVDNNRIVEAEVVVTPDQPLGIWHLSGVALAPLLAAVRADAQRPASEVLERHLGPERGAALARWMQQQHWL